MLSEIVKEKLRKELIYYFDDINAKAIHFHIFGNDNYIKNYLLKHLTCANNKNVIFAVLVNNQNKFSIRMNRVEGIIYLETDYRYADDFLAYF